MPRSRGLENKTSYRPKLDAPKHQSIYTSRYPSKYDHGERRSLHLNWSGRRGKMRRDELRYIYRVGQHVLFRATASASGRYRVYCNELLHTPTSIRTGPRTSDLYFSWHSSRLPPQLHRFFAAAAASHFP